MSIETQNKDILSWWKAAWLVNLAARTPTAYEGVAFDVDVDAKDGSGARCAWARITIREDKTNQKSIGAPGENLHRTAGVILVEIFTPSGRGTLELTQLLDAACAVYHHQKLGANITCEEASSEQRGVQGPWLAGLMRCEFRRDELN